MPNQPLQPTAAVPKDHVQPSGPAPLCPCALCRTHGTSTYRFSETSSAYYVRMLRTPAQASALAATVQAIRGHGRAREVPAQPGDAGAILEKAQPSSTHAGSPLDRGYRTLPADQARVTRRPRPKSLKPRHKSNRYTNATRPVIRPCCEELSPFPWGRWPGLAAIRQSSATGRRQGKTGTMVRMV